MAAADVMPFRVEQMDALLRFLKVAYADEPRKSDPLFWRWHFLENPNAGTDGPPLWVVTCANEIVGQLATIPVQIKVANAVTPAIWILDFILRKDFRGQGLGKRLVLQASQKYPSMITLGINEQSAGLFRSLGWVDMGRIHRYQKLLFAGNGIKGAAEIAPVREILNWASAPLRWGAARANRNTNYNLKRIDKFGPEFDDLWNRSSAQWVCAVPRDSRTLAWQFERQPGKSFQIVALYDGESLKGYAVLFFRRGTADGAPEKAAISDLCYAPENAEETLDALIEFAVGAAISRRAGSLVTDILDRLAEERLERHGFWRIRKSPQFMAYAAAAKDRICDPRNWFLTRGDSDVSIIEPPNTPPALPVPL